MSPPCDGGDGVETALIPRWPRFGPPGARGHLLRWDTGEVTSRAPSQLEKPSSVLYSAASRAGRARRPGFAVVSGPGKAEDGAAARENWGEGHSPLLRSVGPPQPEGHGPGGGG